MGTVVSLEELIVRRRQWKGNGQRVVFVAGCFDLLHPGHIRLLEQARDYGDVLVVGVLSDSSVAANFTSAPGLPDRGRRPIMPAPERCEIMAALAMVDFTFECDESAFADVITRLAPDSVVEASELSLPVSALRAAATRSGIDVIRVPLEPGHSTSLLIERITQLQA